MEESNDAPLEQPWTDLKLALGEMLIAFGQLDGDLQAMVWIALGVEADQGSLVTTKLSYQNLVRVCAELFALEAHEGFAELRPRLERVGQERDRFTHAMWEPALADEIPAGSGPGALRLRWTRSGHLETLSNTLNEIRELTRDMRELSMDLEQLP